MCNLSKGVEEMGGIKEAISMGRDFHIPEPEIFTRLKTKFSLTDEQARKYMEENK